MEKPRILIVEDESIIAHDLKTSLKDMDYEVINTVVSGAEAIETAGQMRPDLALMDIELQGDMDGIEAAETIRSRYNIPVIYLTAYADDHMLQRARQTGPFGYLIKPFDDRELHFSIQMALYKHRMDEEVRKSKEQFQSLLENTNAIPWEVDAESMRFTYIGPQAERITGYAADEWTDFESWAQFVHPEDRERVVDYCTEQTKLGKDHDFEYRMVTKDGRVLWARDIVSVVMGNDGNPRLLHGFILDVTQRKEAELERERLITELQDALAKIKTLKGLLPICAWCKKVRDDDGYWKQVEHYISEHSEAEFTHGMCPDCQQKMEGELKNLRKKD